MARSVISVENLGKRYELGVARHDTLRDRITHALRATFRRRHPSASAANEFWALKDVSIDVKQGEVVGIIGRNGAGKSTLLKILSRITEPTTGRVSIRGRVASLLEVGTGFHPELTGRENIFLNGAILGMTRAEIRAKFDEIVAFAEIDRFLDTPVKHYSSGMYVRLAFAVAAHLEPEILIVDEVLAVGDAQFQKKCLGKMEASAGKDGRTVLFVSHNMAAVAQLCHRGIMLQDGGVVFDGSASDALNRYLASVVPDSGGSVDFGASEPHNGITFRHLKFNGGEVVANGGPLTAEIRIHVAHPFPKLGIGIGLCTLDGRRIATFDTDNRGGYFTVDQAGEYTIQLEAPTLDVVPGRYRIDIGMFDGNHQVLIYHRDCCALNVQAGATTPPHFHDTYGDVRPGITCRVLR